MLQTVSSDDAVREAVARWVASLPTAAECARAEVEPFRDLTPAERLEWFVSLQKSMDAFVRLRTPSPDPGQNEFWRHWKDPQHGRPR
jgi:hypothetical protein